MAIGNNLAGQFSGDFDSSHLESLPGQFRQVFWYGVIAGGVMLLLDAIHQAPDARREIEVERMR